MDYRSNSAPLGRTVVFSLSPRGTSGERVGERGFSIVAHSAASSATAQYAEARFLFSSLFAYFAYFAVNPFISHRCNRPCGAERDQETTWPSVSYRNGTRGSPPCRTARAN